MKKHRYCGVFSSFTQGKTTIVDPGIEHEPIVKWYFFKSHRTIRFRTLKLHTHAIHCIDRYNFKLEICIKMHEISWNYIDRHNFKLDICIKIWKTASLDTISNLKMTCFRTKTEVLESWNFVGKGDLQNASKKRLGSCSIPGSATWALAVIFAQNCVFWTFKKLKK